MEIGPKLRALRQERKLSQGDIERRTGLISAYTSRVENNHTVPSLGTLEKYARALNMQLWELFFDGPGQPKPLKLKGGRRHTTAKEDVEFTEFEKRMVKMSKRNQSFILMMATKMAKKAGW